MDVMHLPTLHDIAGIFAEEVTALGGVVRDAYDDGERLFTRAVLGGWADVRPGDHVRAGVALRAVGDEVLLHPYTFRLVCSNGAIVAHAVQTRRVERVACAGPLASAGAAGWAAAELRLAVRACAAPEAFRAAVDEMRGACEVEADLMLQLLPVLARLPRSAAAHLFPQIAGRFAAARDLSAFGLMNAITAVARDTRDPETRWRLEEMGAAVPALVPRPTRRSSGAECEVPLAV